MNILRLLREWLGNPVVREAMATAETWGKPAPEPTKRASLHGGTTSPKEVARRRAANRAARDARKGRHHRPKVTPATRAARVRRRSAVAARSTTAQRSAA